MVLGYTEQEISQGAPGNPGGRLAVRPAMSPYRRNSEPSLPETKPPPRSRVLPVLAASFALHAGLLTAGAYLGSRAQAEAPRTAIVTVVAGHVSPATGDF